ncbi:hypothetical protein [Anaeromyxobacter dehalogenans]|uniref:DUF3108 domain-containing protein n=1 Tax=Anaeromyxobacter dehalogenans (strain 2CP-C) TaxID=290397 RepID=Q2IFD4_ANADE|nr:hypothetical protein [Anaeromyxobacter dehalogenans]ABC83291.1 hypothetical protein Adeh_3525 [Anaeromyxobacter dehalogenans 2CP-C]
MRLALALALALLAPPAGAVEVRSPPGALHGFPSMSDASGAVVADGELVQERRGEKLFVRARWVFPGDRVAEETAEFSLSPELAQERFAWVETDQEGERRRFEVDFAAGRARSAVRGKHGVAREDEAVEVPRGRAFAGYGVALAASQLAIAERASARITFVAFTPKPRTVTLEIRNDGGAPVEAAGRTIPCVRYTLHPRLPFPLSVFAKAPDAHLWLTRAEPRALVRAEQNLAAKDDPRVTIDVIPRGRARAHPPVQAHRAPRDRRGRTR